VKTYNKFSKLLNQSITETSHFLCIESKNQVLRPQKIESLKEIGTLDYKGCKYAKKEKKKKATVNSYSVNHLKETDKICRDKVDN
jgi:hypothetical protein